MLSSPITKVINHLSNMTVESVIVGGAGYLCARAFSKIDPRVGLACGATAGAINGLFNAKGSNSASFLMSLAAISFIPFQICQRLELPVTFKAAVALSGAALTLTIVTAQIFQAIAAREDSHN